MKVYVAGPMRGIPLFNFPAFDAAAARLVGLGHEVFNPADRDREVGGPNVNASATGDLADIPGFDLRDALADDLSWIARHAEAVAVLPGWEDSSGSRAEVALALALGLLVAEAGSFAESGVRVSGLVTSLDVPSVPVLSVEADATGVPVSALQVGPRPSPAADAATLARLAPDWESLGAEYEPLAEWERELLAKHPRGPVAAAWDDLLALTDEARDMAELEAAHRAWRVKHAGLLDGPRPDATGEQRVTSSTGGQKGRKLARFDLVPAGPLRALAEHYGKGAEKYADRNWERGYEWSLNFGALQRHVWAWWAGEDVDAETGSSHLTAVAWHAFALMEFARTHPEFDDRPGTAAAEDAAA